MLINPEIQKLDLKNPYVWIATWFGAGLVNKAPGTVGSLAALPFAVLIVLYTGAAGLLLAIIAVSIIGYGAAKKFDIALGSHDSKMIVIDEVAGQWITLLPVMYYAGLNPALIILGFIAFRFFDIIKPWPVSWADKTLKGAVGVMLDDILAGIMAATLLGFACYYLGMTL